MTLTPGDRVKAWVLDTVPDGMLVSVNGIQALMPHEEAGPDGNVHPDAIVASEVVVEVLSAGTLHTLPRVSQRRPVAQARDREATKTWETLQVGATVDAVVTAIEPHRAQLDVAGVDAFVHVSDLQGAAITHPGQVLTVGQKIPLEIQTLDERKLSISRALVGTPTPPVRLGLETIQHRVVRLLQWLLSHAGDELAPETRNLIDGTPHVVGVLAGAIPAWIIPDAHTSASPSQVETDLAYLSQRVRLLTGFGFSMTRLPGSPLRIMFCNVTGVDRIEACRGVLRPLGRFRDIWRGQALAEGGSARRSIDAAVDVGMDRARELLAMLRSEQEIPNAIARPTDIRHLGMLTMCRSQHAIESLLETIRAWDRSLALFGRHGITLCVSDDSPEGWREKVETSLALLQTVSGLRIRYTWRSPRQEWIDAHDDSVLRQALQKVVGGVGPCPNRNWSLLNVPKPCLQLDDDITPEVVTVSHRSLRETYVADGKGGGSAPQDTALCPLDVLGVYGDMAMGALGSPVCTGADDVPVDDVVVAAGASSEDSPYAFLARCIDRPRGLEVVKGPAFFPDDPTLMPFQPPIRDGDEAFVAVLNALGREPTRIPVAVHQRAQAGSRAPADHLLWVTTRSQLGWRLIRLCLSQLACPVDLQTIGKALSEVRSWDPTALRQLWEPRLRRTLNVAQQFVITARQSGNDASAMQARFDLDMASLEAAFKDDIIDAVAAYGTVLMRLRDLQPIPFAPELTQKPTAS